MARDHPARDEGLALVAGAIGTGRRPRAPQAPKGPVARPTARDGGTTLAERADLLLGLALAAMLVGASMSLSRLYADGRWALPTWLVIASAIGLGTLLRRLGAGMILSVLGMAAGFFLVVGNLLFPETLWAVIPTRETLTAMGDATREGLTGIVSDAAPVEVTRYFLLLTCAGVWVVTFSAEGLAFRAAQPLLAIVPALGLFVFPAMVRPGGSRWYALWFLLGVGVLLLHEGRARLASWGRWTSHPSIRPGSRWRLPQTPAATTARRLALAAGALALAAPWLLPGFGREALIDYKSTAGGATVVEINPFVSLKETLTAQGEGVLFTVETPQRSYWRLVALDLFDGVSWDPSRPEEDNRFREPGFTGNEDAVPGATMTEVSQRIRLVRLGGEWMPGAADPVRVEAPIPVVQHDLTRGLSTVRPWRNQFEYTVVSQVLTPNARDLARDQPDTPGVSGRYLELPPDFDPAVASEAERITANAPTAYAKALALQDHFRSAGRYTYSLDVPELESDRDLLADFVLVSRRGYCQQFSAAMAAMARSVGIPSRVAVGFTPGVFNDGHYEIRARDAHAWPELWFAGVGWTRFEPTPVPEGRTSDPEYTTLLGRQVAVTSTTLPGAGATPTPVAGGADPLRPEEDIGDGGLGDVTAGLPGVTRALIAIAVVLVAAVVTVPTAKGLRAWQARRRGARGPRTGVREAWGWLADWALDAGLGRHPAETPSRWSARLAEDFPGVAGDLEGLARRFTLAEYSTAPLEAADAAESWRLARAIRGHLGETIGWRQRLLALFSLRSLLGERAGADRRRLPSARGA